MKRLLVLLALSPACLPEIEKDDATVPDDSTTDDSTLPPEDADGDGYPLSEDCDDDDSNVHPGAAEVCDGVDNNCVDGADEGLLSTWYADQDQDGYGDDAATTESCAAPTGAVSQGGDCDDTNPAVHPNASEACDGLDNDCDGADDPTTAALHFDTDDAVAITHNGALNMGLQGAVEAWIWWEGSGIFVFDKFSMDGEDKFMSIYDNLLNAGMLTPQGNSGAASSDPTTVPINQWVHVAASWDDGDMFLFINGALVDEHTMIGNDPTDSVGALWIGQVTRADQPNPLPGIAGYIADFRLSTTTRYAAEFTPESSLAADADTAVLYKMDEGAGVSVFDQAGNGLPGSILGASWSDAPCRP